jgi:hypothetical protein
VTERLRVREIDDYGGRRLVRIIRRGSGSVVTWRRAQMVLLSAQGMDVPAITKVAFTSEDRVRDVIRIEAQFTALRYFALDGTDHASHKEQASMIRRTSSGATTMPTMNGSAVSSTGQTLPDAAH